MLTKWGWKNFHLKVRMKGGGGGGGAGVVDYPVHMKNWHSMALDHTGIDTLTSSMTDIINAAFGADPYTGETAYDPSADITAYELAITNFDTLLAGINEPFDWAALFVQAETSLGTPVAVANAADVGVIGDIAVGDAVVGNIAVGDIAVPDIVDTIDVDGISEAEIVADIDAFADQLDDEINIKVLPRFESGMLDINAVASSAYAIGRSTIEGFRNREVAKHASALRLAAEYKNADMELGNVKLHLNVRQINVNKSLEVEKTNINKDVEIEKINLSKDIDIERTNISKDIDIGKTNITKDVSLEQMSTEIKNINAQIGTANAKAIIAFHAMYLEGSSQMLKFLLSKYTWEEAYMRVVIEGKRIKIVAKKEEAGVNLEIDEAAATWDLEVFQHGANLLASIGGGTMIPGEKKGKSQASSAIGGALAGAAAGAMVGSVVPGIGTAVGAVVGGVLGAASSFL